MAYIRIRVRAFRGISSANIVRGEVLIVFKEINPFRLYLSIVGMIRFQASFRGTDDGKHFIKRIFLEVPTTIVELGAQ